MKRIPGVISLLLFFTVFLFGCPGNSVSAPITPNVSTSLNTDQASSDEFEIARIQLDGIEVWSRTNVRKILTDVGLSRGETMPLDVLTARTEEAIKELQKQGLFSDIQVSRDGGTLIFKFEEFNRVSNIEFNGNTNFDASKLKDVLLLQQGDPANPFQIKKARRQLTQFYRQQGYSYATVEMNRETSERKRTVVTFRIRAGDQNTINEIDFKYVPEKGPLEEVLRNWDLRLAIPLKPGAPISKQAKKLSIARLKRWYKNRGYIDARIDVKLWRNLQKDGIDVTFEIREGPQYEMGEINFVNNQLFADTELREHISLQPGDIYRAKQFSKSLRTIQQEYQKRGYANASLTHPSAVRQVKDEENRSVGYIVKVREGRPVYVQDIEVHGNTKTYDKVIRREIRLQEGDLLDLTKKRNSLRRLRNLGFFKKVEMNVDPGSASNRKIVRVRVKEGRTGQFQFGGGFSSSTGLLANLSVRKDNFSLYDWAQGFTGRGQSLEASANVGDQQTNFNVSWDDPWFNDNVADTENQSPDHPLGLGWSAFNTLSERDEGYDEIQQGGSVRISREFGPARSNKIDVEYAFQSNQVDNLSNAGNDIPLELENEAESKGDSDGFTRNEATFEFGIQRDRRDNRLFPTDGYFLRGSNLLAADFLGGEENYYKPTLDARAYIPFWNSTYWAFRFDYETLASWEDETGSDSPVPSNQKFFLGGNQTIRGYEHREILVYHDGDNDSVKDDKLSGGQTAFFTNLEMRFPVMEETMQAFVFADIGNVYADPWTLSLSDTKKSTGFGFRIQSPMGPINISWAQRLDVTHEGADDKGETQLDFNIGRGF